jgi:hypothetical protein
MTSLQNRYKGHGQFINMPKLRWCLTFVIASKLRPLCRRALMATSLPPHSRFETSACPLLCFTSPIVPAGNSKCSDPGGDLCLAHVLYNDLTHLLRTGGAKSMVSRA